MKKPIETPPADETPVKLLDTTIEVPANVSDETLGRLLDEWRDKKNNAQEIIYYLRDTYKDITDNLKGLLRLHQKGLTIAEMREFNESLNAVLVNE